MPKKIVFNESQIKELRKLIREGVRQSDIAKYFRVTDDTIRRICKEIGIETRMPYKCTCIICGDTFYSNVKGAKTCSKEHHRACVICGKDFIVDRYNIKDTCSTKCTSQKLYGVDHFLQSESVKQKRKDTLKREYGVENISQLESTKQKVKETNLERYNETSPLRNEEVQAKRRATNVEKFGVEEPLSSPECRKEIEQTNLEKYGDIYPMRTEGVQDKYKATMMQHYGVDNPMKSPQIVENFKSNNQKKYGVDSPAQLDEIKEKISQTVMDRYGVPWACMRKEARNYSNKSSVNVAFGEFLEEHGIEYETEFWLSSYKDEHRKHSFSYDFKCGSTLIELNPTATHNTVISINSKTDPLAPDYHLEKSRVAEANGYRCMHVFQWDTWDSILSIIKPRQTVYARKCQISEIDKATAEQFTALNHIQGSCKGQVNNLGLYYNGELVEVITFGTPRYTKKYDLELLRLCTRSDLQVIGGASKLFSHFVTTHQDASIISYCDMAKFSGAVYTQMKMTLDHLSDPSKIWSKKDKHITDNLLRQRGFDQIFNTSYGKGTSNEKLMLEHGWLPVYDCGQKVFVWK